MGYSGQGTPRDFFRSTSSCHTRYPCGGLGRRQFLGRPPRLPALAGMPMSYVSAQEPKAAAGKADAE